MLYSDFKYAEIRFALLLRKEEKKQTVDGQQFYQYQQHEQLPSFMTYHRVCN